MFSPTDTIVALATAPAPAGIGVVRISGVRARQVARAILSVPHDLEPRHATLTHVRAAGESVRWSPGASAPGVPIDEVVATLFPAPHSYTAEDVVEISAHGSVTLLGEILRAAIAAGARLAEPGEFTLRAFLNGRIDLVQAEAVADLVDAVTPLQAHVAFDQLDGTLTRAIGALDEQLFDLAARLEASVDFPEEGYHFVARGEAAETLARVRDGIDALLATSAAGRLIREGRHIAILGKPNVGKSSLFNELLGTDRAIVAAGPGTTRDMLRETIDLDGLRLGLVDTAGIRVSEDEVEQEGVVRARRAAAAADLVILVLDRSRPFEDIDIALIRETSPAPRLIVINKIDLPAAWSEGELAGTFERCGAWPAEIAPPGPAHAGRQNASSGFGRRHAGPHYASAEPPPRGSRPLRSVLQTDADRPGSRALSAQPPPVARGVAHPSPESRVPSPESRAPNPESRAPSPETGVVHLSLKTREGLDELRAAVRAALDVAEPLRDAVMVTNVRHETLLGQARESLTRAIANIDQAGPPTVPGASEIDSEELVLADIADARHAFEDVTGKRTNEDVLRRIFERFCIGK
jgi:tRNA modification GTPase